MIGWRSQAAANFRLPRRRRCGANPASGLPLGNDDYPRAVDTQRLAVRAEGFDRCETGFVEPVAQHRERRCRDREVEASDVPIAYDDPLRSRTACRCVEVDALDQQVVVALGNADKRPARRHAPHDVVAVVQLHRQTPTWPQQRANSRSCLRLSSSSKPNEVRQL